MFGGTTTSSGFNAIKNTNDADSSKNENEAADNLTGDADIEGFQKTASHEKLLEQASEYEKSHNNRQHFEEIDKFTGEEGEQHVLQVLIIDLIFVSLFFSPLFHLFNFYYAVDLQSLN